MTPVITSRSSVTTADTKSDPRQPSRFEKKSTPGRYPASDGSNGFAPLPGLSSGARRTRTADLLVANEALFQLSYSPACV